jgi:biotin/methionine sulfoxide reductase
MSESGSRRSSPTATHWGSYEVETVDGRVVALRPVADDPDPSPIGPGMPQALYDDVRLRAPMVRKSWLENGPGPAGGLRGGESFVEVGWPEALDLAAGELARVKREHGNEAIYGGSYGWGSAGRFHHAQSQVHRFLAMHGGYTSSVNSYSTAALEVVLPHVIGGSPSSIYERMPRWDDIAEHTELVLAFGGLPLKNSQVNTGGIGRHETASGMRKAAAAGVRFVSVSPLRGDAADFLDARWIAPRPNTDTALMLGMLHTMLTRGTCDTDFLERCCAGWDRLSSYLAGDADGQPKDSAWAASVTGLAEQDVEELAALVTSHRTLVTVSWSLQRAHHGEQPYWAAVALASASGSMGRPGGGFGAGYGGEDAIGSRTRRWSVAAFPQPENPVKTFIPVARIADMLLGPGQEIDYDGRRIRFPDVRLVYWCGGNPFHHHQDLHRLVQAWQRPDTVVVHDAWWTPVARFADIVFPVAVTLEREDLAFGLFDDVLVAMPKAAEPPPAVPTDYGVFSELADRLGFAKDFTEGRSAEEWVRELYHRSAELLGRHGAELPSFEEFWAEGRIQLPARAVDAHGSFARLREDPERYPLRTPTGRIEIFSETVSGFGYDDCPGHPAWLEPAEWLGHPKAERFPLHLVSNQPRTRLHSQYDNGAYSRQSKIAGREPLTMNADDAAERGIDDGDVVRVFNDRGAMLAGAVVSDGIRRGVVQIATGAWFDPVAPGTTGSLERHGNPNVLTLDTGTSRLAQGPSALTALVEVERAAEADLEPVTVFRPPPVDSPGHRST